MSEDERDIVIRSSGWALSPEHVLAAYDREIIDRSEARSMLGLSVSEEDAQPNTLLGVVEPK